MKKKKKQKIIVGVDEAGRGPLAGCVVAAAFSFSNPKLKGIRVKDSKKLSSLAREDIFSQISCKGSFAVGLATHQEIDQYNILQATFIAFNRAIERLIEKDKKLIKAHFIIDGNLFQTNLPIDYECMKKADERIAEVSCASIIAKLFRDYLMRVADFCFPGWEFNKHKGYPTIEHKNILKQQGLSPLHRKSFSPCYSLPAEQKQEVFLWQ